MKIIAPTQTSRLVRNPACLPRHCRSTPSAAPQRMATPRRSASRPVSAVIKLSVMRFLLFADMLNTPVSAPTGARTVVRPRAHSAVELACVMITHDVGAKESPFPSVRGCDGKGRGGRKQKPSASRRRGTQLKESARSRAVYRPSPPSRRTLR